MPTPTREYYEKLPAKRMASGVLFLNEEQQVLILRTSYKTHWEIPGGMVEHNESPRAAAVREVKEEIGLTLDPTLLQLLSLDYMAGNEHKTEALMFVYFGGIITKEMIKQISLTSDEIVECAFTRVADAIVKLGPVLGARIARSISALESSTISHFEGAY